MKMISPYKNSELRSIFPFGEFETIETKFFNKDNSFFEGMFLKKNTVYHKYGICKFTSNIEICNRDPSRKEIVEYKQKFKQCKYLAKFIDRGYMGDQTFLYCIENETDAEKLLNNFGLYPSSKVIKSIVDPCDGAELLIWNNHEMIA